MMQSKILLICTNDKQSMYKDVLQEELLNAKHNIELLKQSVTDGHDMLQNMIKKKT